MKPRRDSSDFPGASRSKAAIGLPHDDSGRHRAAEIEALLDRVATPAPKGGRWQASNRVPAERPSKLELVDVPLPPPGPSTHAANSAFVARTFAAATGASDLVDYLAIATREFDEGHIDQTLWARAFALSGGDESSARPNYLRARANALRIRARAKPAEPPGGTSRPPTARTSSASPGSPRRTAPDRARRIVGQGSDLKTLLRSPIAILAALVVVVTAAAVAIALAPDRSTPAVADASKPSSAPANAGGHRLANHAAAGPVMKQGVMNTIEEMKEAGQWNVVVAQALAWTEREPENAAAWNELSIGYARTQRTDEAHAAARKAVQLAPNNAQWWINLGQLSLARDVPIEALLAYEEAIRLEPRDGESLVAAGILDARLDRLAEAKLAFDNALALNSRDANARCGVSFVAQKQARPDVAPRPPAGGACRDLFEQANKGLDSRKTVAAGDAVAQGR